MTIEKGNGFRFETTTKNAHIAFNYKQELLIARKLRIEIPFTINDTFQNVNLYISDGNNEYIIDTFDIMLSTTNSKIVDYCVSIFNEFFNEEMNTFSFNHPLCGGSGDYNENIKFIINNTIFNYELIKNMKENKKY